MFPQQKAPHVGRESRTIKIGARTYRVHALPPRQALRVAFRMIKAFGESIGALLTGGLVVPAKGDVVDLGDVAIPVIDGHVSLSLEDAIQVPEGRAELLSRLLDGLAKLSPEDLDDIVCDLLVSSPPVLFVAAGDSGDFAPVTSPEDLDGAILGPMELVGVARVSLTISTLPTLADAPTPGGSSAVATSP